VRAYDACVSEAAAVSEGRIRARSLWLDGVPGSLAPRPALGGDVACDVAIVGAGLCGLWTAYSLAAADPSLRIALVERAVAGFGPAGRNAGFVSAGIAGEARVYARRHGMGEVVRAERAIIDTIDHIGAVVERERIACAWVKGGSLRIATSAPQLARTARTLAAKRAKGWTAADMHAVSAEEIASRVRVAGVRGGTFTPHCARVDPARLARGLAEACERHGVTIYEETAAEAIEPGSVRCAGGIVRADVVVRATESYTIGLPGERRRYLPVYSHMIATEPLPDEVWGELGWEGCETLADQHHLFVYAQRTQDRRIALGGAAAPYRFASSIREADETRPRVRARLEAALRELFPAAAGARITHSWGGPFAVPRDWSMAIGFDRTSGLAAAGGFSGHGQTAACLAGRTLADLILRRESDLTTLPFVDHECRPWEPEPVRIFAARGISGLLGAADGFEDRTDREARVVRLVERWLPPR
jgi:glycine/D-amino acid oxidase-like deaminating enzyme